MPFLSYLRQKKLYLCQLATTKPLYFASSNLLHIENRAMTSIDPILATIEHTVEGATLADLLANHPHVARRTLQRWLAGWVKTNVVQQIGKGRARRYVKKAVMGANSAIQITKSTSTPIEYDPHAYRISADAADIVNYLGQPLRARKPVGYQRDFLEGYIPNSHYYLDSSIRRRLHEIGSTDQSDAAAGTHSRAIMNRLLIDLSWASSNLEGNTYSRLDTRDLIEFGREAEGKPAMETQMILNHKAAIEMLVENIDSVEFNRFTIMNLHSALAENLLPNPADEGRIRQHTVAISHSVYKPLSGASQISELLEMVLNIANQIIDPFEQAFFVMVHLPYLQPFADINKRVSRLAANIPLFRANLCPITFLDVPPEIYSRAMLGVYEMTRTELLRDVFVWAYERSTQEYLAVKQTLAQPDPQRLAWRTLIKNTIRDIVQHPEKDALKIIDNAVDNAVPENERTDISAIIIEELRRIHEGVLARYGLRMSEYLSWQAARERST